MHLVMPFTTSCENEEKTTTTNRMNGESRGSPIESTMCVLQFICMIVCFFSSFLCLVPLLILGELICSPFFCCCHFIFFFRISRFIFRFSHQCDHFFGCINFEIIFVGFYVLCVCWSYNSCV